MNNSCLSVTSCAMVMFIVAIVFSAFDDPLALSFGYVATGLMFGAFYIWVMLIGFEQHIKTRERWRDQEKKNMITKRGAKLHEKT